MAIPQTRILISGAGIAGLTLAYWLREYGFDPTVVELRPDLSDEGYMIDFYGSGFDVAEKMDLLEPLHARHYPIPKMTYVDGRGRARANLDLEQLRKALDYRHFNFMRGDLADVLYDSVKDTVPIRFGTSIAGLEPLPDGLRAAFSDGSHEDYALVIGADGIHSNVRRLVWGSEGQFERFLGFYVACGIAENFLDRQDAFYTHVVPHRQAGVYAIRGNRLATFFAFSSERLEAAGRGPQNETLARVFGEMGWIVPELVEATRQSQQLYFDTVSQIELAPWSKGRVALVGDACQCLSLLAGQGASMAMAGAYILANRLHEANGQHLPAFEVYERELKPEIDRRQEQARGLARWFVPESRFDIWTMFLFLRLAFLPPFRAAFRRQIGAESIIR